MHADFTSCYLTHDIDNIWSSIENNIVNAMKLFIPIKKHHLVQHPPWFTSDIRHCINHLCHKQKSCSSTSTQDKISSLESSLQNKINTAKQEFESRQINTSSTNNSKNFKYLKSVTQSKCFKHIITELDQLALKEDVNALVTWSGTTDMNFNLRKTVYLSFKRKTATSYSMFEIAISQQDSHKDLGIIISEDLSWIKHYSFIIARAYKILD